ncbi:hypothetical protein QRX50_31690 [Amycolatopsis carbonis]|uniref:Uncharacterized protein n=1 Tax=Amycolatopsis carbonis TaxID=715471 RepID=A0A9Y2ICL1_9PSEU|nr:hypothetical protein [Amycolatopsis sp. 2-15]WIX76023.1 hypothetical protein QRX50_31690 [Amycolatopsis sp. 2-15]
MPSVCVNGCGFKVEGGSLGIDWAALGAKRGRADFGGWTVAPPLGKVADWSLIMTSASIAYKNVSCRAQHITFWTVAPVIYLRQVPGNDWNIGVTMASSKTGDPAAAFPSDDHSYFRERWHQSLPAGTNIEKTTSFWSKVYDDVVQPGETFFMRNAWWFSTPSFASSPVNIFKMPVNTLHYLALPVAD